MLIFFDFDGTINDMSERWWNLHRDGMHRVGVSPLIKKTYFFQKREAVSEKDIVQKKIKNKNFIEDYCKMRIKNIEKQKYLGYDFLIPYTKKILKKWGQHGRLILLTNRNSESNLLRQMKEYKIEDYFFQIIVTKGKTKEEVLKCEYSKNELKNSFLITDSPEEIKIGKKLGMKTLAIGYGTRSVRYFQKQNISDIIRTPKQLLMYAQYVSKP